MTQPRTLSAWFSENPIALKVTLKWLEDRRAERPADSLRGWFRYLQTDFGFPFRDYTALLGWLNREHRDLYHTAKPEPKAAPTTPPAESFKRTTRDVRKLERRQDFLVTSAVANCYADPGFLAACERWRDERQGVLAINPVRYHNPKTKREALTQKKAGEWWDPALHEYMLEDELRPHPFLSIMTTKAQATAHNPLPRRLDGRTKARSAVFGHPQLAMRTVPTPQEKLPKILYSSGAITEKEYSDTTTGDMAYFHHSLAGVIVEVRGKRFHLREIIWDGEKFIDLDRVYYADRVEDAPRPAALVMGDIHVGSTAVSVEAATFGPGGIVPTLAPRRLVLHDVGDFLSVNPHEAKNRLTRAAQSRRGLTNLHGELYKIANWLGALPDGMEIYAVPSNHDNFLDRWLQKGEQGVEAENLAMYHELSAAMLRHEEEHEEFPLALELALRGYTGFDREDVRFIKVDESVQVKGVELGAHGHLGPNGARGGPANMSRIGTRGMYGHVHSPCIWQGANFVGTSTDYRMGYNAGPSSWLHTHGLVHDNGYRQMVHIIGDDWRG